MDVLGNDTRDIELTPGFIEKSDKDIATIEALDSLAREIGNILVLSGGYATEAHCGGKISRSHGDIDAHIILTGDIPVEEIFSKVHELLNQEDTKWILREQKPDKVDYLEDSNDKEFFERRRVEVRLNPPHETNTRYPRKTLIDSDGRKVKVTVVDLTQMVSDKISKFYELRGGINTTTDRHSSRSDFIDLKRLLELDELDQDAVRNKSPKEYDYVTALMRHNRQLISASSPPKQQKGSGLQDLHPLI